MDYSEKIKDFFNGSDNEFKVFFKGVKSDSINVDEINKFILENTNDAAFTTISFMSNMNIFTHPDELRKDCEGMYLAKVLATMFTTHSNNGYGFFKENKFMFEEPVSLDNINFEHVFEYVDANRHEIGEEPFVCDYFKIPVISIKPANLFKIVKLAVDNYSKGGIIGNKESIAYNFLKSAMSMYTVNECAEFIGFIINEYRDNQHALETIIKYLNIDGILAAALNQKEIVEMLNKRNLALRMFTNQNESDYNSLTNIKSFAMAAAFIVSSTASNEDILRRLINNKSEFGYALGLAVSDANNTCKYSFHEAILNSINLIKDDFCAYAGALMVNIKLPHYKFIRIDSNNFLKTDDDGIVENSIESLNIISNMMYRSVFDENEIYNMIDILYELWVRMPEDIYSAATSGIWHDIRKFIIDEFDDFEIDDMQIQKILYCCDDIKILRYSISSIHNLSNLKFERHLVRKVLRDNYLYHIKITNEAEIITEIFKTRMAESLDNFTEQRLVNITNPYGEHSRSDLYSKCFIKAIMSTRFMCNNSVDHIVSLIDKSTITNEMVDDAYKLSLPLHSALNKITS